jgi:hypothetical protein
MQQSGVSGDCSNGELQTMAFPKKHTVQAAEVVFVASVIARDRGSPLR